MKFNQAWNAGQTVEGLLDDFAKIAVIKSSRVLPDSLSQKCDLTKTSINYNYEDNWELWDRIPGRLVFRSENVEPGLYKYVSIYIEGSGKWIRVSCYEDWDKVTHTGVNQASGNGGIFENPCCMYDNTKAGSLTAWLSNTFFMVTDNIDTLAIVCEFSRLSPLVHPKPYPAFVQFMIHRTAAYPLIASLNDGGQAAMPRYKSADTAGDRKLATAVTQGGPNIMIHGNDTTTLAGSNGECRSIWYSNGILASGRVIDRFGDAYFNFEAPMVSVFPGATTAIRPNYLGRLIGLRVWTGEPDMEINEAIEYFYDNEHEDWIKIFKTNGGVNVAIRLA